MQQRVFTIAENAPVARDTYRLQLTGDTAAITAPGQFVDIRLAGYFLRRPVSVCSWSDGALTLYYKVAGAGTAQLSTLTPGTELDLLVGLGNGFDTAPAGARPLLVGGGVGASPLYGLAQQLVAEGRSPLAVLGFRTAAMALRDDSLRIDDARLRTLPRLAIVLGTEGDGLAGSTIAACDYTVRIPMTHGVDSLNVAAASAVAFYQLALLRG